jgi:FkbM family methyltransferase
MPRIFNAARRLNSILRGFPKLRQKVDSICVEYHQIQENFNYNIETNGERWLLQALARKKMLETAFDVGANHGDWAALVLTANPNATVHCFEICPPTFQKVLARLSGRKNIFLNSFGLSDAPGEVKIKYSADGDGGTTMFDVTLPLNTEIINARVGCGKDYCAEHGIKKIDCLKLDVEGAEHLVLKGFGDMLNPAMIPIVQFEYGMVNIVTKFLLKDFHTLFESRGYKVGKLFPGYVRFREYRFSDEDFRGPNYVAASPELAALLEIKSDRRPV